MIWEKLQDSFIFTNLEAEKETDVFAALGGELIRQGYAKEDYIQALEEREKDYPTGLDLEGIGVAIPHTDISHVNKTAIAVATLAKPVRFHEMGGEEDDMVDVDIIFMLCVSDPGGHMDVLQRVINIIQDKSVMQEIKKAASAAEIISIIQKKEDQMDREEAV